MATPFPPEVERWRPLIARYFPPEEVDRALWVVWHESGGDPGIASRFNAGGGEDSHGLFQINLNAHPTMRGKTNDPEAATAYAAKLFADQGWKPWSVTHKGFPADLGGSSSAASVGSGNVTAGGRGSTANLPALPQQPGTDQARGGKPDAQALQFIKDFEARQQAGGGQVTQEVDEFGFPVVGSGGGQQQTRPNITPPSLPGAGLAGATGAASGSGQVTPGTGGQASRVELPGGGYMILVPETGDYALFMPKTDTLTGKTTIEFAGWRDAASVKESQAPKSQGAISEAELRQAGAKFPEPGVAVLNGREYRKNPDGSYTAGSAPAPEKKSPALAAVEQFTKTQQALSGGQVSSNSNALPTEGTGSATANPSYGGSGNRPGYDGVQLSMTPPGILGQPAEVGGIHIPTPGGGAALLNMHQIREQLGVSGIKPSGDNEKDIQTAMGAMADRAALLARPGATPASVQAMLETERRLQSPGGGLVNSNTGYRSSYEQMYAPSGAMNARGETGFEDEEGKWRQFIQPMASGGTVAAGLPNPELPSYTAQTASMPSGQGDSYQTGNPASFNPYSLGNSSPDHLQLTRMDPSTGFPQRGGTYYQDALGRGRAELEPRDETVMNNAGITWFMRDGVPWERRPDGSEVQSYFATPQAFLQNNLMGASIFGDLSRFGTEIRAAKVPTRPDARPDPLAPVQNSYAELFNRGAPAQRGGNENRNSYGGGRVQRFAEGGQVMAGAPGGPTSMMTPEPILGVGMQTGNPHFMVGEPHVPGGPPMPEVLNVTPMVDPSQTAMGFQDQNAMAMGAMQGQQGMLNMTANPYMAMSPEMAMRLKPNKAALMDPLKIVQRLRV